MQLFPEQRRVAPGRFACLAGLLALAIALAAPGGPAAFAQASTTTTTIPATTTTSPSTTTTGGSTTTTTAAGTTTTTTATTTTAAPGSTTTTVGLPTTTAAAPTTTSSTPTTTTAASPNPGASGRLLGTLRADTAGIVTGLLVVPFDVAPGDYDIVATGAAGIFAPTAGPLSVSPTTVSPGGIVSITGTSFSVIAPVAVSLVPAPGGGSTTTTTTTSTEPTTTAAGATTTTTHPTVAGAGTYRIAQLMRTLTARLTVSGASVAAGAPPPSPPAPAPAQDSDLARTGSDWATLAAELGVLLLIVGAALRRGRGADL